VALIPHAPLEQSRMLAGCLFFFLLMVPYPRLRHAGRCWCAAWDARSLSGRLEDATPVVFGVTLDQATLVDLVPSAAVRTALQEAEAAVAAGDVAAALGKARIGFELSLREDDERVRQATGRHPLRITAARLPSAFSLGLQEILAQFGRAWDDLIAVVKRTDDAVRLMAKGIDYADYMRFAALTPHPFWTLGSSQPTLVSDASQPDATIDDARWAVDFALRSALVVLG
jgi:hypothetical protein